MQNPDASDPAMEIATTGSCLLNNAAPEAEQLKHLLAIPVRLQREQLFGRRHRDGRPRDARHKGVCDRDEIIAERLGAHVLDRRIVVRQEADTGDGTSHRLEVVAGHDRRDQVDIQSAAQGKILSLVVEAGISLELIEITLRGHTLAFD